MKFAETSWWVTWSLPGDGRHGDALTLLDHLGPTEQAPTTNLVVGETWTFLRRQDGHGTPRASIAARSSGSMRSAALAN